MKRRWVAGLVATTTAVVTLGLSPSAYAATGDEANSQGQFLYGSLLTGDLSNVAGIDGATATYTDGVSTPPADEESAGLDLEALSAVGVTIPGGVSLPLGDLLQLGAVNQYAWAGPDGVSRAASGAVSDNGIVDTTGTGDFPAGASLDLTQLLGQSAVLDQAGLDLQGVTGVAALTGTGPLAQTCDASSLSAPENCRDYNIAGATLGLHSQAVGQVSTTADQALGTLSNTLNGLSDEVVQGLLGGVTDSLDILNGLVPGLSLVSNNLTVQINANLQAALDPVLNQTLDSGQGVQIDMATGAVNVDLAQILDLNNLDPNTSLLSPEVLQNISGQISDLLDGLQQQIDTALQAALDNVTVNIGGGVCLLSAPIVGCTAGLNLSYNGSLQDLLDGSQDLGITGSGTLGGLLTPVLGTLTDTIQGALSTAVTPLVNTALTTAGNTIDGAVTTLTNQLSQALTLVGNVADVRINVQEPGDPSGNGYPAGSFVETAVRVNLLGDTAAQLNLGTAVVGPNTVHTYDVTLAATDTPAGQDTTVTGGGWPANTDVTLQMQDPDGNDVGDPVTVTTDADGNLPAGTTLPVPADAAPGTYSVVGTDAGGETATAPFQVTDQTAPEPPVIQSPTDGASTNDPTPPISGTAEPGSTVDVYEDTDGDGQPDGDPICSATADGDGNWTCSPTTALDDGDHTIVATATDDAGNTSDPSAPVTFTVDTAAPDAPVITGPEDGSISSDPTPTITGTGEPGATVTVTRANGDQVCTATVDAGGDWTCDSAALPDGTYTISATQADEAGNVSDPSNDVTFTIDTAAPDAPVITGPADGSTINDTTPTITGTGEPGASVTVTDEAGDTVCTATVDADGTWTCDSEITFSEDDHTITATQTDPAGNVSDPSAPVTFTVDTSAPAVTIESVDGKDASAPVATQDPTPTFVGTSDDPGSTVNVVITDADGNQVASGPATVAPDGSWTFIPGTPLDDGNYTAVATATDEAGNSAESNTAAFTVDTTAPAAPEITSPADGSSTNDTTPTITGTGEPGDEVTVTDEGGNTVCTATVETDGTWSCTPDTAFSEGDHTITATQTDPAGNESPASDPVTFTVDTTAPAAPEITSPSDGDTVTDNTPTITGNGDEPGNTITVTDEDGNTVCTATVQPDGTWSCTPDSPLSEGDHTLTATETDPAGNASEPSAPVSITVDSTVADPTITGPSDGSTITDRTPTITGTGEPGATVTVQVDGQLLGTVKVGDDGTWSLPVGDELAYGSHTVSAVQRDAAGNVSNAVTSTFTVAPPAPVITSPGDGDTVSDTPTVTGTGRPGAQVTVYADGKAVGAATVNSSGDWKVDASQLSCGDHTLSASQSVDTTSARLARAKVHGRVRGRVVTSAQSPSVTVHVACPTANNAAAHGTNPGTGANTGANTGATTGASTGAGSTLPNTGAPAGLAALIGLGLGFIATGVLVLARRRRDA